MYYDWISVQFLDSDSSCDFFSKHLFSAPKFCNNLVVELLWWTSPSQDLYDPCLFFTHTTLRWIIYCLCLLVLPKYDPYHVTKGVSSPPPSSKATTFLDGSCLSNLLFMTALIDY